MKIILMCLYTSILFASFTAWSCKVNELSEWRLSNEKIVQKSENVWIGKLVKITDHSASGSPLYGLEFEVQKTLKGKYKAGQTVAIGPVYKSSNGSVTYSKDCKLVVPFTNGKTYVVLNDTFHPKSVLEYQGAKDTWLKEIESLIKN